MTITGQVNIKKVLDERLTIQLAFQTAVFIKNFLKITWHILSFSLDNNWNNELIKRKMNIVISKCLKSTTNFPGTWRQPTVQHSAIQWYPGQQQVKTTWINLNFIRQPEFSVPGARKTRWKFSIFTFGVRTSNPNPAGLFKDLAGSYWPTKAHKKMPRKRARTHTTPDGAPIDTCLKMSVKMTHNVLANRREWAWECSVCMCELSCLTYSGGKVKYWCFVCCSPRLELDLWPLFASAPQQLLLHFYEPPMLLLSLTIFHWYSRPRLSYAFYNNNNVNCLENVLTMNERKTFTIFENRRTWIDFSFRKILLVTHRKARVFFSRFLHCCALLSWCVFCVQKKNFDKEKFSD